MLSQTIKNWENSPPKVLHYKKCWRKFFYQNHKEKGYTQLAVNDRQKLATLLQERVLNNYNIKVKGEKSIKSNLLQHKKG